VRANKDFSFLMISSYESISWDHLHEESRLFYFCSRQILTQRIDSLSNIIKLAEELYKTKKKYLDMIKG
jgi:hypothetical protein